MRKSLITLPVAAAAIALLAGCNSTTDGLGHGTKAVHHAADVEKPAAKAPAKTQAPASKYGTYKAAANAANIPVLDETTVSSTATTFCAASQEVVAEGSLEWAEGADVSGDTASLIGEELGAIITTYCPSHMPTVQAGLDQAAGQ